jgi:predicted dithiol-disulfide oxidoreductase (DUF899 family)
MNHPDITSHDDWLQAREELLVKEKALTRELDAMAAQRRRLPMFEVEEPYAFEAPEGEVSLLDLFDGRRQLLLYRFFFDPGMEGHPKDGCVGCSMMADEFPHPAHLHARDTSLVLASRGSQADIERYQARMGWSYRWVTITDDFDRDFGVEEWSGLTVFLRDGDRVFKTYFTTGRGTETLGTVWGLLDLTPFGRQEEWEDSPEGYPQDPPYSWWKRHDEYEDQTS